MRTGKFVEDKRKISLGSTTCTEQKYFSALGVGDKISSIMAQFIVLKHPTKKPLQLIYYTPIDYNTTVRNRNKVTIYS